MARKWSSIGTQLGANSGLDSVDRSQRSMKARTRSICSWRWKLIRSIAQARSRFVIDLFRAATWHLSSRDRKRRCRRKSRRSDRDSTINYRCSEPNSNSKMAVLSLQYDYLRWVVIRQRLHCVVLHREVALLRVALPSAALQVGKTSCPTAVASEKVVSCVKSADNQSAAAKTPSTWMSTSSFCRPRRRTHSSRRPRILTMLRSNSKT